MSQGNIVPEPGAENLGPWVATWKATREKDYVHDGAYSFGLLFNNGVLTIFDGSWWEAPFEEDLIVGNSYGVDLFLRRLTFGERLDIKVDRGDGAFATIASDALDGIDGEFFHWQVGTFVALGTAGRFQMKVVSAPSPPLTTSEVRIDSIRVRNLTEEAMAAKLEDIRQRLVKKLRGVRESAGFSLDVATVIDHERLPKEISNFPEWQVVLIQEIPTGEPEHPISISQKRATFAVKMFHNINAKDEEIINAWSDIEEAIETREDAKPLGLGYVRRVHAREGHIVDTDQAAYRDVRLAIRRIDVTYRHDSYANA